MSSKVESSTLSQQDGLECLLAYRDADGSVRSVGPLARERAEALAAAWGRVYPNQTCWVEPLAREVQDIHLGRVRRRRTPVLSGSPQDH